MAGCAIFLSMLLARIVGDSAKDWFEANTNTGRKTAQNKLKKEIDKENRDFEKKQILSDHEYERVLEKMAIEFERKKEISEEQLFYAQYDWAQKDFIQKCWPLRNPFDVPFGFEPKYDETKTSISSLKLKTVKTSNHTEVVPLRIISALKNNELSYAQTVNSDLSVFLLKNYPSSSENAVLSDIGSWKNDSPVNDATINYLYMGLKGQPTMILAPEHTQDGTIIRLKIWSWALGDNSDYPSGFEAGWLDTNKLYSYVLASEIKLMWNSLKKIEIGGVSKEMERDMAIIKAIEEKGDSLTSNDIDRLLSILTTPKEVIMQAKKKTNSIISAYYSCFVGMYSDAFLLRQYGVVPKLPFVLSELKGINFLMPAVRDYYLALLNSATTYGLISAENAVRTEIALASSLIFLTKDESIYLPLVSDAKKITSAMGDERANRILYVFDDFNNRKIQ